MWVSCSLGPCPSHILEGLRTPGYHQVLQLLLRHVGLSLRTSEWGIVMAAQWCGKAVSPPRATCALGTAPYSCIWLGRQRQGRLQLLSLQGLVEERYPEPQTQARHPPDTETDVGTRQKHSDTQTLNVRMN